MGWLARLLGTGVTRDLLADLTEDYRAEAAQATHLRTQADRARYPQMAVALRRLADIEERHATWLKNRLVSLSAAVPEPAPTSLGGVNQWQRTVGALHDAQAKRRRLVEQISRWDPDEPEVVALLRRIEQEDAMEFATYDGIIMRSDPQAVD
jgi:hypothetical protein